MTIKNIVFNILIQNLDTLFIMYTVQYDAPKWPIMYIVFFCTYNSYFLNV